MVRRLIVAAAVAVASLGANADWIYWNFKNVDGSYAGDPSLHSLYVFVSGVTAGNMNASGSVTSDGYNNEIVKTAFTVQSKDVALSKISSILAENATTASLGNLSHVEGKTGVSGQTEVSSLYTAIGAASFTAFAIVFDAPDIKNAQNYMLLEDYSVKTGDDYKYEVATTYASAGETIKSEGNENIHKTVVFGDRANGVSTAWKPIATIPEPTSGVMLLLGVAALALKRKK